MGLIKKIGWIIYYIAYTFVLFMCVKAILNPHRLILN
jgi:hypothetical protein